MLTGSRTRQSFFIRFVDRGPFAGPTTACRSTPTRRHLANTKTTPSPHDLIVAPRITTGRHTRANSDGRQLSRRFFSRVFPDKNSQLHKIPPFPLSLPPPSLLFVPYCFYPSFSHLFPFHFFPVALSFPFLFLSRSLLSPKSSPEVCGSAVSSPSGVRGVASRCWIL